MTVQQIYELSNTVTKEVLGAETVVNEDLSNVVDIGTAIFNANAFDNYVKSLINHIGKVIFVNRSYRGSAPSVLMDSWEYGSILEKISSELPVATENPSWELVDGQSYDPHVFHKPTAQAKFYNSRTTLQVERSITKRQVKESFSSASQLNGFISMLHNETEKALTIRLDALIMRVINSMIADTAISEFPNWATTGFTSASGVRAVNLLYVYNQKFSASLTPEQAITTPAFIRFAAYQMGLYSDRLTRMSNLFNTGGKSRFTPKDVQHIVMLAEFASAADIYLQSDTFHDEYTRLVKAERVPYWQGSGKSFSFSDTSKISVTTETSKANVTLPGILAIMFDREALGVTNYDRRVETEYNPVAEFTNYWYKMDAGFFNDEDENFVVFFVA